MTRTSVRYYITKEDDRPIVRGVPVVVATAVPATPMVATEESAPAPVVAPRRANARRVSQSVRSTVRRRQRASVAGTIPNQTD